MSDLSRRLVRRFHDAQVLLIIFEARPDAAVQIASLVWPREFMPGGMGTCWRNMDSKSILKDVLTSSDPNDR